MKVIKDRVLLIFPQFKSELHYGRLSKVAPSLVPVSLVYLATFLQEKGIPVKILDGQVQELTPTTLRKEIEDYSPRFVGITSLTPIAEVAHQVAAVAKGVSREITVVMGGTHPTVVPEETIRDENVDIVVRQEGEHTLYEIVDAIIGKSDLEGIKGLTFRRNGEIIHTEQRPFLEELDSLPLPDWSLVPLDSYHQIPDATFRKPVRCLLTSRGCPFRCIFCSARLSSGYHYRVRSPRNVIEEIDLLINRYGARQLAFLDDNFIVDQQRAMAICDLIIKRGYHKKVVWTCAGRADQISEPLLKKFKDAGCALISYGVETGSQRLLDIIKKSLTIEQIEEAVRLTREVGIKVRGTLMLGLPTETPEESQQTIEFAKKLGLNFAKFSLATPYPGTELYRLAKEQGLLKTDDWRYFSSMAGFGEYDPVYIPEGRDARELKQLQKRATREFYIRPRQIWDLLRNITSFHDIKLYLGVARELLFSKG